MKGVRFFPEEKDTALRRIYVAAIVCLPIVAAGAAFWGVEHFASASAGGLLILLCGLWTHGAVRGGFAISTTKMKRRLWWRIGWRFVLLVVGLYAILQAPWLQLESFAAGLSLFIPAVLIETALELKGKKA